MEIPKIPIPDISTELTYTELLELKARAYNETVGTLTGYDCGMCRNKGYIAKVIDETEVLAECRCLRTRETLGRIKSSGLEQQLHRCTFRNFECYSPWTKAMKESAENFAESDSLCLFLGGQSGCGKTHICTAAVGQLIRKGKAARYFVWRDESPRLKSLVNESSYFQAVSEYKNADVLYIDDLFMQKEMSPENITDADVKLAFEIIDYRLRNSFKTIISSNFLIGDIIEISEPLGSRIYEAAEKFCINIPYDKNKNYRLRR